MAVTLDEVVPGVGDDLPLPWHWGWFNDAAVPSALGRDGHPRRGGFLPPVALPRRMWAGGFIEDLSPIRIGREIRKASTIEDIQEKSGRSGALCLVTVLHEFFDNEDLCIRERQNLVYREDPDPQAPAPVAPDPPQHADIKRSFVPDPVLMFRYSAVTFNGHRIHYDADYAREVEGYRGLVFHGPLTATLLYSLARQLAGTDLTSFRYRATSPLICGEEVTLCGKQEARKVTVWAQDFRGKQAMIAEADSAAKT